MHVWHMEAVMGKVFRDASVGELVGKTASSVIQDGIDQLRFTMESGEEYLMFHSQDCCESVTIDDICGDLNDLVGSPFTLADESTSSEDPGNSPPRKHNDSFTWTFYRFATAKGYVTIRWYGESNGYCSESVSFNRST